MNPEQPSQVTLYTAPDGETTLEVRSDAETVWLTRQQLAALFVTFLSRNGLLEDSNGVVINNNALAAITLLVAMSDPKEKDLMIALITRMIAEGA